MSKEIIYICKEMTGMINTGGQNDDGVGEGAVIYWWVHVQEVNIDKQLNFYYIYFPKINISPEK